MAAPPISAMLTCGRSEMRWNSSWKGRVTLAAASILSGAEKRVEISARSAPPENTFEPLLMCSTLQSLRTPSPSRMAWKAVNISPLKAFTGGRLSVTVAMRSATARMISSLISSSRQAAADDQALDVVGAFVDLRAAHAAADALHAELLDVAGAAQRLHCVGTDLLRRLGGEQLGHGGFGQA